VSFAPVRLVTEGVIFLNAVLCTVGVLLAARVVDWPPAQPAVAWAGVLRRTVVLGLLATVVAVVADWGIVRGVYGDRPAAGASKHIRFGPDATVTKNKPTPGVPHP